MLKKIWTGITAGFCMIVLILDTKTAISGAQEGIRLCLSAVIPSLLPFLFLSFPLTASLMGSHFGPIKSLGRLMRLPLGSESIFLVGALGGYPTGAQVVAHAYSRGFLTRNLAERMLGFCSNAGPAFIFGIAAGSFSSAGSAWILWLIHILSAAVVGMLLPGGSKSKTALPESEVPSLPRILKNCINTLAQICAWVIIFRVILAFANRWILWFFNADTQIFINGIAEMTNGCTALPNITCEGVRFILCSVFLSFGGICVMMQTISIAGELGLGMYVPGKLLQSALSFLASALYQQAVFSSSDSASIHPLIYLLVTVFILLFLIILQKREKRSSNPVMIGV